MDNTLIKCKMSNCCKDGIDLICSTFYLWVVKQTKKIAPLSRFKALEGHVRGNNEKEPRNQDSFL